MKTVGIIHLNRGINKESPVFYCQNMRSDPREGLLVDLSLENFAERTASTPTENLGLINGWAQRKYENEKTIFAKNVDGYAGDQRGNIWAIPTSGTDIFQIHSDSNLDGSSAIGAEIDIDNEFVWTNDRYVAKTVSSTLDGNITTLSNTVTINTTVGWGGAGIHFFINNEAITGNYSNVTGQITNLTRAQYDTDVASHIDNAVIVGVNDTWLDIGQADTDKTRPMLNFGTAMFVGAGSEVLGWKLTQASDWSNAVPLLSTLPSDVDIIDFAKIPMGAGSVVLIGADRGGHNSIFVWDGSSTTEWEREIELEAEIVRMNGYYIATNSGIYVCDGYSVKLLATLPDSEGIIDSYKMYPTGLEFSKNQLIVPCQPGSSNSTSPTGRNRDKTMVWLLDLATNSWTPLVSPEYKSLYLKTGAVIASPEVGILVASSRSSDAYIDKIVNKAQGRGNYVQMIYEPNTGKKLRIQKIKLNVTLKEYGWDNTNDDVDFDIVVRYYDYRKPFLRYTTIQSTSSDVTHFTVGTTYLPEVGDRAEIISRDDTDADVAFAPRNVDSINTTTGVCTLTEGLPNIITSTGQTITYNPLKHVKKIEVRDKIDLIDLEFAVADLPIYKKCMIEVEFRMNDTSSSPRLETVEITSSYD